MCSSPMTPEGRSCAATALGGAGGSFDIKEGHLVPSGEKAGVDVAVEIGQPARRDAVETREVEIGLVFRLVSG